MAKGCFQGVLVVVAHRRHHSVCLAGPDLERGHLRLTDNPRPEAGQLREPRQAAGGRTVPKHQQQRFGQPRFDENVERAAAGTRRRDHQLAALARVLDLVPSDYVYELGRAFGQRAQCLPPHHGLGAAAADPPAQTSVSGDHRLVAGLRRGRRPAANDRRERAWRARGLVLTQQVE